MRTSTLAISALTLGLFASSCSDDPATPTPGTNNTTATEADMTTALAEDMPQPTADFEIGEDQNETPDDAFTPPDMRLEVDMNTAQAKRFEAGSFQRELTIETLNKNVGARVFFPKEKTDETFVVVLSHGGIGSPRGEFLYPEMGESLAKQGFVALHVGHRPAESWPQAVKDRPAEVSYLLDALANKSLPMPPEFKGTLNLARVGHAGHSAGAYTSHAVGGAVFTHGSYTDPRIAAIVPISPQGKGREFDAFDNGPQDNSWRSVVLPSFILIGREEVSTSGQGRPIEEGWRLQPFLRYTTAADRFQAILSEQGHRDMWSRGSDEVRAYITANVTLFFRAYLRGDDDVDPCAIGTQLADDIPPVAIERIRSPQGRLEETCPS